MNFREAFATLRRSWLLIAATTTAGILLGIGASYLTSPVYKSTAQLFVSMQGSSNADYTSELYIQQRVRSYLDVVKTPRVLEPVVEDLELDATYLDLASRVSATSPPNTVLIDVNTTAPTPDEAAELANAAARSLAREIGELETSGSGQVGARAQLISPGVPASAPVSPNERANLAIGALLGLGVGIGLTFLRSLLDTRIKSAQDLLDAAESPLLGSIPEDPDATMRPLVIQRGSLRAESYRTIRTNLQYIDPDAPPKCIVITSAMPGEGKSTTATNLAISLAQSGSKVLLVEADLRRPRTHEYLGISKSLGLTDVLVGKLKVEDALVAWNRGLMDFLPAGTVPPNPTELLGSRQMASLLLQLRNDYDTVILDSPPLEPVSDAAILATSSDGVVVVARFGETRFEQVRHASDALRQVNARIVGTILNRVPRNARGRAYHYHYAIPQTLESDPVEGGHKGHSVEPSVNVR